MVGNIAKDEAEVVRIAGLLRATESVWLMRKTNSMD